VLTVNLRSDGQGLSDRALRLHAAVGEPDRLTTRQLLRDPPAFSAAVAGRIVSICENPTVAAAAANRLAAAGGPLVCLEGRPRTAARLVRGRLAARSAAGRSRRPLVTSATIRPRVIRDALCQARAHPTSRRFVQGFSP
jgi:hypothetical protein